MCPLPPQTQAGHSLAYRVHLFFFWGGGCLGCGTLTGASTIHTKGQRYPRSNTNSMVLTVLKALPLPQPKSGGKSHQIGPRGPRESQVLNHRRQLSYNAFPLATIHSRSQKPVAHSYPKVRGHCSREDGRLKACDMLGQWSAWTWQQLLRP